jgi:GntR family transcriptional regulator / MocR family aminotransferase
MDWAMATPIVLDRTVSGPLHLQIATRLRAAITAGVLVPGARLPSARSLAGQLGVARGTVDAGYAVLIGEGVVARLLRHDRLSRAGRPRRSPRAAAHAVRGTPRGDAGPAAAVPHGAAGA